jgi:hypothetical protein
MNSKHRKTLEAIFTTPVNGALDWSKIEALRSRVIAAREFLEKIGIQP